MSAKKYVNSAGTSFVGFEELLERWPVDRRTAYRAIKSGRLPRPIPISAKRVGWPRPQIDAFLNGLATGGGWDAAA